MSTSNPRQPGQAPRGPRSGGPGQRQPGGTGRSRRPRPRPLPSGNTLYTPDASPARSSMEQRSATPLLFVHQLPVWLAPVLAVGLLVLGLAVGGWIGAVALLLLAGALAWLAAISWPRLSAQGRLLRVVVVGAVVVAAVLRGLH